MTKKASIYAGYAAIGIGIILISIKAYAYHMSGSVSILSSLTDSVLDSVVSLMVLGSIYYARRPADTDHRWGHGKMEAISALFQSAIIAGGAAFLIFAALLHINQPTKIQNHEMAIMVMAVSIMLSILIVIIQRMSLKKDDSLAIEADSAHYGSDVLINMGAMLVLYLNMNGQAPQWLDPLFAIIVAIFMAYLVRGISSKSLSVLLDRELPEREREKLINIIEAHEKVIGWHDLRTHSHGTHFVISFDIEVCAQLSLLDAHQIAKDLEDVILKSYPESDILIHVDPEGFTEDARHKVEGVHM